MLGLVRARKRVCCYCGGVAVAVWFGGDGGEAEVEIGRGDGDRVIFAGFGNALLSYLTLFEGVEVQE